MKIILNYLCVLSIIIFLSANACQMNINSQIEYCKEKEILVKESLEGDFTPFIFSWTIEVKKDGHVNFWLDSNPREISEWDLSPKKLQELNELLKEIGQSKVNNSYGYQVTSGSTHTLYLETNRRWIEVKINYLSSIDMTQPNARQIIKILLFLRECIHNIKAADLRQYYRQILNK